MDAKASVTADFMSLAPLPIWLSRVCTRSKSAWKVSKPTAASFSLTNCFTILMPLMIALSAAAIPLAIVVNSPPSRISSSTFVTIRPVSPVKPRMVSSKAPASARTGEKAFHKAPNASPISSTAPNNAEKVSFRFCDAVSLSFSLEVNLAKESVSS